MDYSPIILLERGKGIKHNLSDSDYSFLIERHKTHLTITKSQLKATYYVGLIECPSGQKIFIKPKVSVQNLLYIVAYTYDVVNFYNYDDSKEITNVKTPIAIYVIVLLNWIELLFKKGLLKSYRSVHDETSFINGRIIDKSKFNITGKVICEVEEQTFSGIENQIIKATLSYILKNIDLSDCEFLRHKIKRYLKLLDGVDSLRLSTKTFTSIKYNRLNKNYKKILELCALIYSGSFLFDANGSVKFSGFLVNMEKLFEKFIFKVLEKRFHELGVKYQSKHEDFISTANLSGQKNSTKFIADIEIPGKLVVEVKYYTLASSPDAYDEAHLRQTYNSCITLNVNGLIIYPHNKVEFTLKAYTKNIKHYEHIAVSTGTFPINSPIEKFDSNISKFLDTVSTLFS